MSTREITPQQEADSYAKFYAWFDSVHRGGDTVNPADHAYWQDKDTTFVTETHAKWEEACERLAARAVEQAVAS